MVESSSFLYFLHDVSDDVRDGTVLKQEVGENEKKSKICKNKFRLNCYVHTPTKHTLKSRTEPNFEFFNHKNLKTELNLSLFTYENDLERLWLRNVTQGKK